MMKFRRYVTLLGFKNFESASNLAGSKENLQGAISNQLNQDGECIVHIASGMGQLDLLKFLCNRGVDLFRLDENGENAVHWAARQGHCDISEFLHRRGVSIDARNWVGDTPLHLACKQSHEKVVGFLIKEINNINATNEEGETALHVATMTGCTGTVRLLLNAGAKTNVTDQHQCTPLHWALRKHHTAIATMLLQYGCDINIVDNVGESPIHIVAREGLLSIAQTLCAFGCKVEICNKNGQFPLHLATRSGHLELVRCLCLAGCNIDIKNKDGITAEIIALAQGNKDMLHLLNRLRNVSIRESYINQLIPSTKPIPKIKLKLFGHSGVGKSTFVDNIKCGYFTSWFRRSVGSMSPKSSRNKKSDPVNKSSIELNRSGSSDKELRFKTRFETYTHGIEVQQHTISGIGEISIWEFSGHEPYYMVYDNFIGNTNCLHLVFFSLSDPYEVQLRTVRFWMAFLQSRIPVQEPLGYCGKSGKAARVALVATHADISCCHRVAATDEFVSSEASSVLEVTQQRFGKVFDLHDTVFVLDTHGVASAAMKALKCYIAQSKDKVTQGLPKSTGFLEDVYSQLSSWRKSRSCFPVMPWQEFIDLVHSEVNPLTGEEHLKELIQQLQIMGEVLYIACDDTDRVILDPSWFCGNVLGHLLSQEQLEKARVTGVYSENDVQLMFPEADAAQLLSILEALQLCTECETDGDIEYEFPCFNLIETLDGLWNKSMYTVYGGVKLYCQHKYMLASLFPRLQVCLRRSVKENPDPDNDLYQWYRGSKFSNGLLEGLITLELDESGYEIKVRGPASMRVECFFFLEELIAIAEQMFSDVCPGIPLERHYISSCQLKAHSRDPHTYPPSLVIEQLLRDGVYGHLPNPAVGEEALHNVVLFGAPEVLSYSHPSPEERRPQPLTLCHHPRRSRTTPALDRRRTTDTARRRSLPVELMSGHLQPSHLYLQDVTMSVRAKSSPALLPDHSPVVVLVSDLYASQLSLLSFQSLCATLDPPDPMGRDWCMLAVLLGMADRLPKLDPGDNPAFSPTACILSEWMELPNATLGHLLVKLRELERTDAVEALMPTLPLFRIAPSTFDDYDSIQSCCR